jgi:hypothetical protein
MTLAELLVVLLITTIVSGAVLTVFLTSLTSFTKGSVGTQVQQAGRVGADRLSRELRLARRLYSGTQGGFLFNLPAVSPCNQISFVLPHMALVTLSDASQVYLTDANPSTGVMPYDGLFVSYYLSSGSPSLTGGQNGTGPYLVRTWYDGTTLSSQIVANNVTGLAFAVGGACPTTASRLVTVTVTAYQQANGVGASSQQVTSATDVVTLDVGLRNQ